MEERCRCETLSRQLSSRSAVTAWGLWSSMTMRLYLSGLGKLKVEVPNVINRRQLWNSVNTTEHWSRGLLFASYMFDDTSLSHINIYLYSLRASLLLGFTGDIFVQKAKFHIFYINLILHWISWLSSAKMLIGNIGGSVCFQFLPIYVSSSKSTSTTLYSIV